MMAKTNKTSSPIDVQYLEGRKRNQETNKWAIQIHLVIGTRNKIKYSVINDWDA